MDTDMFCVICGGPFALEHHIYSIDPHRQEYQWLYDVQLLSAASALHTHGLTSAGEDHVNLLGNDSNIFLSEGTCWYITNADCFRLDDSFYRVLALDDSGDAIFPLHRACIDIACRVVESHASDSPSMENGSNITQLYTILNSRLRAKYATGATGADAYDIFALRSTGTNGPKSTLAFDILSWWSGAYDKFFADPLEISNFTPAVYRALQPLSPGRSADLPDEFRLTRSSHGIEALPIELLDHIASELSARSIVSLHQSSRTLAYKIPLNERFWRRQLCSGSLLPHIWDLDEENFKQLLHSGSRNQSWDWHEMCDRLRVDHHLSDRGKNDSTALPDGFWNRCRIWKTISTAFTSPLELMESTEARARKADTPASASLSQTFGMIGLCVALAVAAWWDLSTMAI